MFSSVIYNWTVEHSIIPVVFWSLGPTFEKLKTFFLFWQHFYSQETRDRDKMAPGPDHTPINMEQIETSLRLDFI